MIYNDGDTVTLNGKTYTVTDDGYKYLTLTNEDGDTFDLTVEQLSKALSNG